MKPSSRPVLAASELAPNLLMLCPGSRPVLACPDCGTWRMPRRGLMPAHRAAAAGYQTILPSDAALQMVFRHRLDDDPSAFART